VQQEVQLSATSFDQSQFLPSVEIQNELGVPTNLVLETSVAAEAPPLPDLHITRASTFSGLARELGLRSVVAVTGYPESGKTIAIAEFAGSYQGTVFWFTVPRSESHPEAWHSLLCYALAKFLDCESISPANLRSTLCARKDSLLVVIDDAHNCHSLDVLDFLFQASETDSPLWTLLVGVDEPDFLAAVREKGLPEWRLRGLDEEEAISLFQLFGGDVNEEQESAIKVLREKTDGHLGMLRLSHGSVHGIQTAADKDQFLSDLEVGLGSGLEALQANMTERLRASLGADAVELCRRLSVAIRPFYRIVGEAVWTLDRQAEEFHKSWNLCSISVFEHRRRNRYAIPDIYRNVFRREIAGNTVQAIHLAIATAITDESVSRDVLDVEAHVTHLLLAEDAAEALTAATMYLALAEGPAESIVKAFCVNRFAVLLASVASDNATPIEIRMRWFAISSRIYRDLGQDTEETEAVLRLYELIHQRNTDVEQHTLHLAWAVVLMHSSQHGNPIWAQEAASHLHDASVPTIDGTRLPFKAYLVLTSYLNSRHNPLAYLRTILDEKGNAEGTRYWNEMFCYEFWRSISFCICHAIENDSKADSDAVQGACAQIEAISQLAREKGEREVQVFMTALLVNIRIDLLRAFGEARQTAHEMVVGFEHDDVRLAAYVHDTYGDSLRCDGDPKEADAQYEIALALWPADEHFDRAESSLMKSICQSRLGRYRDAARHAHSAAELYLSCESPAYMSVARSFLEAASLSAHGTRYSTAVRYLVHAHRILDHHRERAEWPALGQIAWSIATQISPDSINPQLPEPGFTLGLGETLEGAEKMVPAGPTLMLARACSEIGSPYRALSLFDQVISECTSDDLKTQVGSLALEAAVQVESLPLAARYSALASGWLEQAPADGPADLQSFIFNYQLGRTIRLASICQDESEAIAQISEAIAEINETGVTNDRTVLLTKTLQAYSNSLAESSESHLEEAFSLAIAANAIWIAREVAWFWCYRFAIGRPTYENQYIRWHWRLNWLTLQMSPEDDIYLRGCLAQEVDLFGRLHRETIGEPLVKIIDSLSSPFSSPTEGLLAIIEGLATISCKYSNVSETAIELSQSIRLSANVDCLVTGLDLFCTRLLDLVLHPGAPEGITRIKEDINVVLRELDNKTTQPLFEVGRKFRAVRALAISLETGTPTEDSFKSLVTLRDRVQLLSPNSAAQFYIWLRHFAELGRGDIFSFEESCQLLAAPHVDSLLADVRLLPYLRIRLATCQLCAKGVEAHRKLVRAIAIVETQKRLQSPIATSAVKAAEAAVQSAIQDLSSNVEQLDRVEEEAAKSDFKQEIWSCCMERGGTRKLTGTALLRGLSDPTAKERWLQPSLGDFRRAIEMAGDVTSVIAADLVLKPATTAFSVAKALENEAAIAEFGAAIEDIRATGLYDEQIEKQCQLESRDPLMGHTKDRQGPFLKPTDEQGIQEYVDLMMDSTGFPADRREFVEDDVRKIARIEETQDSYCKHLQPLQNLLHLDSPDLAYTSKTRYVEMFHPH